MLPLNRATAPQVVGSGCFCRNSGRVSASIRFSESPQVKTC